MLSHRNKGIGNFQGENPEAYENRPSLRTRGRDQSDREINIHEIGGIEGQSISTIEVVKPQGRSGAVDLNDFSPSLIMVTVEGHPGDIIS
jgi:hypothetical protein